MLRTPSRSLLSALALAGSAFAADGSGWENLPFSETEAKTWSKISTPEDMQVCRSGAAGDFTYLAASDSILYASTSAGLWRLPLSEGTVAVFPPKASSRPQSTGAALLVPSAGSGKVLVTPAPSGRARPGTYDFKGIRQPKVQNGKDCHRVAR